MMPTIRREIEVLLDMPDVRGYIVSAYVDMAVRDGFARHAELHLKNEAKGLERALAAGAARKDVEADIAAIGRSIRQHTGPARGLVVFASTARGLHHAIPLDFPVEDRLVVDEEPFVLPLLERWFGEPAFLSVVVDSDEAHLFESYAGVPEPVADYRRPDVHDDIQRDKPRFTYKKRFAATRHERLHGMAEDKFLQGVAGLIDGRWRDGHYAGLVLLGQSQVTAALRRLLHKEVQAAVVEEAAQAMTSKAGDVADDVAHAVTRWRADRESEVLAELKQRWKEHHLVADGPTDVMDALQQGRAARIIFGGRRDLLGARCNACDYRFGSISETCHYCGADCRNVDATQEILRMALRHKVPVYLFPRGHAPDPLAGAGGVSALLRAGANWAPDPATARASEGH